VEACWMNKVSPIQISKHELSDETPAQGGPPNTVLSPHVDICWKLLTVFGRTSQQERQGKYVPGCATMVEDGMNIVTSPHQEWSVHCELTLRAPGMMMCLENLVSSEESKTSKFSSTLAGRSSILTLP